MIMARAQLVQDNDNERIYRISGNRLITIKISDDSEITYWENDLQIGNDEDFVFIEDEFDYSKYLLARMYVPIKGEGLGRATIEFFKEYFDVAVWARTFDGIEREDGSHLTEDAPAFVDKMIMEGLLIDNQDKGDYYDNNED